MQLGSEVCVNKETVMPIIEDICNREAVVLQRDDTVLEAAKLMRQQHVRDVQIIENRDGETVAVGIITDHDLVVEIMAPELDYMVITVGDIIDLHAV
jgi:predicted transcriptional regulator